MANKRQIKIIHVLKHKLKWDDETYRDFLLFQTNGLYNSSKDICDEEAERIIGVMKTFWFLMNEKNNYKNRYNNFSGREDKATPQQLRMIEALWKEKSYISDENRRLKALNKFIKRIVGVDDIRFLDRRDVSKVVSAIRAMKPKEERL